MGLTGSYLEHPTKEGIVGLSIHPDQKYVPVVSKDQQPLMPTTPNRAKRWVKSKKATYFYKLGLVCVRLDQEPSARHLQPIAVGVDTGGTYEAITLKSKSATYLNIQAGAVTWVKKAVEERRNLRRSRRNRKTPCRTPELKTQKKEGWLAPSTRARWNSKLRIIDVLRKVIPLSGYNVEDIAAVTKEGQRRWNLGFSPLEVGKKYFYGELAKKGKLFEPTPGWRTKEERDKLGLVKGKSNEYAFKAHCQDSWVLANMVVGGHTKPDNKKIFYLAPLQFQRRNLHRARAKRGDIKRQKKLLTQDVKLVKPSKDGRPRYGGMDSLGLKRGSLVKHPKYGVAYVGGFSADKQRISLNSLEINPELPNNRLAQNVKTSDCNFLCYNSWRWQFSSPG